MIRVYVKDCVNDLIDSNQNANFMYRSYGEMLDNVRNKQLQKLFV